MNKEGFEDICNVIANVLYSIWRKDINHILVVSLYENIAPVVLFIYAL